MIPLTPMLVYQGFLLQPLTLQSCQIAIKFIWQYMQLITHNSLLLALPNTVLKAFFLLVTVHIFQHVQF